MLETSLICVIALAWAYSMTLFVMGRREDVLHGNFICSPAQPDHARPTSARVIARPLPNSKPVPISKPLAISEPLAAMRFAKALPSPSSKAAPPALPMVAMPAASLLRQTPSPSTMPAQDRLGGRSPDQTPIATPMTTASTPARPPRASVAERVRAMSLVIERATSPDPRPAAAQQPEILHSLLDIIKRDLVEAASK
ncbi:MULTISPECIES: hypothetical protein [Rhodopseudomonas]|nr:MULTISPECIES: hypothetical protein [Rhodopseudomonas]MDF3812055.1 hypothetical protein [Rhodopseudomonas sp. BAL398]